MAAAQTKNLQNRFPHKYYAVKVALCYLFVYLMDNMPCVKAEDGKPGATFGIVKPVHDLNGRT